MPGEGAEASKITFLICQPRTFESFLESRISSQFDILMTRRGTLIKESFFPIILYNLNLRKWQTNAERKPVIDASARVERLSVLMHFWKTG